MLFGFLTINLGNSPIKILLLVLFVLVFLCLIGLLVVFFRKRNYKLTENKIIDSIATIKKLPLKYRLNRLAELADNNKNLYNDKLLFWRTKYELLYEKDFFPLLTSFTEYYSKNNNKKLTKKELNKYFKQFQKFESEIRSFYTNITNFFEIEFLQRNYILAEQELFVVLNKSCEELEIKKSLNIEKLKNFQNSISQMFFEFEDQLLKGFYEKNNIILANILSSLIIYTEILDLIPKITLIIDILPTKISDLKEKFNDFKKQHENLETLVINFKEIENNFLIAKEKINNCLNNLQYKKANNYINELIKSINYFDLIISEQKEIISFFDKYYKLVVEKINDLEREYRGIFKEIEVFRSSNSLTEQEEELCSLTTQKYKQLSYDVNCLVLKVNQNYNDYFYLDEELLKLIQKTVDTQNSIEKIIDFINQRDLADTEVQRTIHLLEIILLQIEVRLNQLQYLNLYHKYEGILNNYRQQLESKKQAFFKLTDEKKNSAKTAILEQINHLKIEIIKVFEKIKNNVLLELLAQEVIVYIQKYIISNVKAKGTVDIMLELYEKGEYPHVLQEGIKMLMGNKKNLHKWKTKKG